MKSLVLLISFQLISIIDLSNNSEDFNYINDCPGENMKTISSNDSENEFHLRKKFQEYAKMAQSYLNRPVFKDSPITGEILGMCAQITYDSTGILIPLELALSQAQWESGMGLRGLSPCTNPYNVGEFDDSTKLTYNDTFDGVLAYYKLIANDYLSNKKIDDLLNEFVNKNGYRYASNPSYEENVKNTYSYIKRWIAKTDA